VTVLYQNDNVLFVQSRNVLLKILPYAFFLKGGNGERRGDFTDDKSGFSAFACGAEVFGTADKAKGRVRVAGGE
jgi:hypothetical protein